NGGAPVYGAPTARDDIFKLALARFDSSAAAGGGTLAKIGRGRALLNLGDYAGAAAAVAGISTSYAYRVEYSDNSANQENGVYNYTLNYRRYSVADKEGGVG